MNENRYRARAERGEIQIGTWVNMIRTPGVFTLLQAAGLDFVRVDMEHSSFNMETVADMAALARSTSRWSCDHRKAIVSGSRACSTPASGTCTSPASTRRSRRLKSVSPV